MESKEKGRSGCRYRHASARASSKPPAAPSAVREMETRQTLRMPICPTHPTQAFPLPLVSGAQPHLDATGRNTNCGALGKVTSSTEAPQALPPTSPGKLVAENKVILLPPASPPLPPPKADENHLSAQLSSLSSFYSGVMHTLKTIYSRPREIHSITFVLYVTSDSDSGLLYGFHCVMDLHLAT